MAKLSVGWGWNPRPQTELPPWDSGASVAFAETLVADAMMLKDRKNG